MNSQPEKNLDPETELALENISNANSSDHMVVFSSSLTRIMNADPNIFSLTITNQCCINLEYLIYYLGHHSEDDVIDNDDGIVNGFYRSLGLYGDEDNNYPTMGKWISNCPNIHSLTIANSPDVKDASGKQIDFLEDADKVKLFEEINNNNTHLKNLILKNCRFDQSSFENIFALLDNPNIEIVRMYSCHIAVDGIFVFGEAKSFNNITRIEMFNCSFDSCSGCDSADVEMSNLLSCMPSLTGLLFKRCHLSAKAMRIIYNIYRDNHKIASIENV